MQLWKKQEKISARLWNPWNCNRRQRRCNPETPGSTFLLHSWEKFLDPAAIGSLHSCIIKPFNESDKVIYRSAGGCLNIGSIRWHITTFQQNGTDVRIFFYHLYSGRNNFSFVPALSKLPRSSIMAEKFSPWRRSAITRSSPWPMPVLWRMPSFMATALAVKMPIFLHCS